MLLRDKSKSNKLELFEPAGFKILMKRRTVQLARKNSNVFAQFDQKQISELKEAFSFIDQNGDGVVDRDDLKEVWASLGKN